MKFLKILIPLSILLSFVNIANSQEFREKLSNEINTSSDELLPLFTEDGNRMYFIRSNYKENIGGEKAGQDIWYCNKKPDGNWSAPINISKPINNAWHNAAGGIFENGKKIYVSNQNKKQATGISIYKLENDEWKFVESLFDDLNFNKESFMTFYVTHDEKIMLLSFATKDLNEDLYVSINESGKWSDPVSLGDKINTKGYEISPFLMKDKKTLIFASNSLGGEGNADLFVTKRLDDSWQNWTKPKNLGKQINTIGFDAYFSVNENEKTAYFCSGDNPTASSDIYKLKLDKINALKEIDTVRLETEKGKRIAGSISEILKKQDYKYFNGAMALHTKSLLEASEQPDFIDYLPELNFTGSDTLKVSVCRTKEKKECDSLIVIVNVKQVFYNLNITVKDKKKGDLLNIAPEIKTGDGKSIQVENVSNGIFKANVEVGNKINIAVNKPGYFPESENLELTENLNNKKIDKIISLTSLEKGNSITLRNILFETGKAELRPESLEPLNQLLGMMQENEKIRIKISGHTDNVGAIPFNLELSKKRVNSVINYLISKGINKSRLEGEGFGASKPVADNKTEEGKQLNRRVEITVL